MRILTATLIGALTALIGALTAALTACGGGDPSPAGNEATMAVSPVVQPQVRP